MKILREYFEKHYIIGGAFIIISIIMVITITFQLLASSLMKEYNVIISFLEYRNLSDSLIALASITKYRWVNAIISYLIICVVFACLRTIVAIIIYGLTICLEKLLQGFERLFFGPKHHRSLQYNIAQVWLLKTHADVKIIIQQVRFYVCGIRCSSESNYSKVKWARLLTIGSLIRLAKCVFNFFFNCTIIHIIFGFYTIWIFFSEWIQALLVDIKEILIKNDSFAASVVELFEAITIVFLLVYIFIGIRHKAIGYSEIKIERFKELIQMEEMLLQVLHQINRGLENNIDVIANGKFNILEQGATCLIGKACYIDNGNIVPSEFSYGNICDPNDASFSLNGLMELDDAFKKITELNEEFKKSSLNFSNIFLVDHQTMLPKLVYLYFPGRDNQEYKKMELLCRSSMREWFENRFIKPTMRNGKQIYCTEEQARSIILEASMCLDYELKDAFELEVYLKRYEKKLIRRIKNINKFSCFNFK